MKFPFRLVFAGTVTAVVVLAQLPVQTTAPVTPTEVPAVSKTVQKEVGAGNPERVPGYILGPEDQIIVRAFQAEEISDKPVQIQGDGFISLPLVGRVRAGGLTVERFEAELTKDLAKYIEHPQVTVLVADYRSQPVSVMGAVNSAGVVQLRGEKTLVQVISLAGGLRTDASNTVTITRNLSQGAIPLPGAHTDPAGKFSFAKVNLRKVMNGETPQDDIIIKRDDVLTVPKAQMVYVIGEVQKPGGYVLNDRDSLSLLQAISLAGGLTKTAAVKHAKVLHEVDGKSDRVEMPNNVARILAGKAPDISLHADDILFVPNSTSRTIGLRAAETAVSVGTGLAIWRF